jgi:dTDP-4-dehydrorhamnose 3,5-epimerase
MIVQDLAIPEVKLIQPKLFHDERGFVAETLSGRRMDEFGLPSRFVQENLSVSKQRFTVRGLHMQKQPDAQAKLIQVMQGRIFDVAVDVRKGSPTYGKHVNATLTAGDGGLMLVPEGFLHGFCTLEDNTVVIYKMSNYYAPGAEAGVIWNDRDLDIPWPLDINQAIVSAKDQKLPAFKDFTLDAE